MAISAYSSGVNTLSSYSIDVKPDVQHGDMLYWDSVQNMFYTDRGITQVSKLSELQNDVPYATQSWVVNQLANVGSGGAIDLSLYATIDYVNTLVNSQSHFDGQYSSLTGAPNLHIVATSGDYNDLINKPVIFSGDYNDLVNKPTIPSLVGYSTITYVNQAINALRLTNLNIVDGSPGQVLTTDGSGNFTFTTINTGGSGGIELTDLSAITNIANGSGSLVYNDTTGVFTYTPPDLSQYATTTYVNTQISSAGYATQNYVTTTVNNAVRNIQLGDLTDVSPTSPQVGYVLKWNGTSWFAAPDATGSGGSGIALTDISVTQNTPSGTGSLSYNNVTGVFTYTPPASTGGVTSYTQLTNLPDLTIYQTIANAFDGDYNSLTNTPTIPTDVSDLTDTGGLLTHFSGNYNDLTNKPSIPSNLTDLGITDGTNGQVLTTDGSGNYTFTTISSGTSNATTLNNYSASYYLDYNNFTNTPTIPQNLGDLADVDGTATPSTGQVLKWDGSQWAPASDLSSSSGSGIALTDLSVTQNTASGTGALTYDDTTGTFDYTPPDLSNLGGGTGEHIQWTTSGTNNELRISEQWLETGSTYTVRSVGINDDGLLQVELATFSPTVSATGQSLYWDEPATQFSVSVDNPTDFTSRYIDSVYSITGATGVSTTLSDYTAGTKSATPAGGVDWTQTFTAQTSSSSSGGGLNLTMVGYNNDGANSSATWMFADAASATNFKNIIDGMPMPTGTAGGIVYFYDADGYFYRHGANQSSWDTRNFVANIDSSNSNWVNITWSGSGTDMFYQTTNPNGIGSGVELIQVAMIYVTAGQPGHTTNPYEVGDTISGPTWGTNPGVFGTGTGSSSTTSSIASNGTGLTGGTAGATINFADDQGAQWADSDTISYTWQNVDSTISFATLSGQNFLGKYTTVDYTIGITGLSDTNNATVTVGGTGGTLSNTSGDGTLTFADALHKDNNTGRDVDVSVEFSRPAGVTGTAYTVTDTDSDTNINASFTYPSFYYWTSDVNTVPTRADIVDGNDFDATVTELGNQAKSIQTTITNSGSQAQAFWFAVRSSATQPTVFQTGPSSALLSDVNVTTGNTVDLEPDAPEAGYVAEEYTLYGITLQPGDTYMRIN